MIDELFSEFSDSTVYFVMGALGTGLFTIKMLLMLIGDVVRNMRTWRHSGFSVDRSVFLEAGDSAGIERLVQYMVRCPFRLCLETPRGRVGPRRAQMEGEPTLAYLRYFKEVRRRRWVLLGPTLRDAVLLAEYGVARRSRTTAGTPRSSLLVFDQNAQRRGHEGFPDRA